MKAKLITVIPVYNGAEFIVQTLESVAAQTLRPDRVIVQDNLSTDKTEELVKSFKPIRCEWRQNEKNLGWLGNANRGLEYATETNYLHLLCADDLIRPAFYKRLTEALEPCDGLGLGYSVVYTSAFPECHLAVMRNWRENLCGRTMYRGIR